jgi:hypothetical protein
MDKEVKALTNGKKPLTLKHIMEIEENKLDEADTNFD